MHIRRSVYGLRGPASILRPRRTGDLPVLVHVVSQRAQVLRLRRTETTTRDLAWLPCCLPPQERSRHPVPSAFRSSIARPTDTSVYASSVISRYRLQDSRPGWIRCFLSCRALSSPTTCRFSPALSCLPTWSNCLFSRIAMPGGATQQLALYDTGALGSTRMGQGRQSLTSGCRLRIERPKNQASPE